MEDCEFCKMRGKTWRGEDPICAFRFNEKVFVSTNWNCATMNLLRKIVYDGHDGTWWYRNDIVSGSIGVIRIPDIEDVDQYGYIVMTWYKDRGRTENAIVVDGEDVELLTFNTAKGVIKYYLGDPYGFLR